MTTSCGVRRHTVDKVNDCEYRCWRCGADESVMEREEEAVDPGVVVLCPTRTPEVHQLGEFPMSCYPCHVEADS